MLMLMLMLMFDPYCGDFARILPAGDDCYDGDVDANADQCVLRVRDLRRLRPRHWSKTFPTASLSPPQQYHWWVFFTISQHLYLSLSSSTISPVWLTFHNITAMVHHYNSGDECNRKPDCGLLGFEPSQQGCCLLSACHPTAQWVLMIISFDQWSYGWMVMFIRH